MLSVVQWYFLEVGAAFKFCSPSLKILKRITISKPVPMLAMSTSHFYLYTANNTATTAS